MAKATNQNMTLAERATYLPESFETSELIELMEELQAYRKIASDRHMDTPEELARAVDALEEAAGQCNDGDHAAYDDYKEFYDTCVEAAGGAYHLGYPNPWDNSITQLIVNYIEYAEHHMPADEE